MTGLLGIAYSGLSAFQRALEVTGNNIVNQHTKGYSRQSIHLSTNPTQRFGSSYMGNGVTIAGVNRNVDQFTSNQVRTAFTARSQYESFYQQAIQIDRLLVQDGSSISASMHSFFDALGQLNDEPGSLPARNVVFNQSKLLANQFNSMQMQLDQYKANSTTQISDALAQINHITSSIAALNVAIRADPNDLGLLDERDELLKDLSQFAQINVMPVGDGTINVSLSEGDSLVTGAENRDLLLGAPSLNSLGTHILMSNGKGQVDITTRLSGGVLGGLLDYEQNVIGKSSQLIGQMAIGLAQTFNDQHKLGMDLNNLLGTNFFNDYNTLTQQEDRVSAFKTNAGTAVLSVAISDISKTKLTDYTLIVTDAASNEVRVVRNSDGFSTTLNATSNPPAPPGGQLVIDGMTINVDNMANWANTDSFSLMPTRGAAASFGVAISNANQIAFASPVATLAAPTNTGLGQIALGSVVNTAAVANTYQINFVSPTEFVINNLADSTTSGPFTFIPNTNNTVSIPNGSNPSYSVILSGLPEAGDTFTAEYNLGGTGDNRNGLNLFGLQQSNILSDDKGSLFDAYASLLNDVGNQVKFSANRFDASEVLYQSALDLRDSQSGVDENEEGANLERLKQSYEAAGKLMKVSSDIINILFEIMR